MTFSDAMLTARIYANEMRQAAYVRELDRGNWQAFKSASGHTFNSTEREVQPDTVAGRKRGEGGQ